MDPWEADRPRREAAAAAHAAVVDERGWDFQLQWRELGVYRERVDGAWREFVFEVPMGTPEMPVVVPTADRWPEVVPDWLRDRREQVLERIRASGRDHLVETDTRYRPEPG